jgi:hypothetical protein
MSQLAWTYSDLGRHEDALAMKERVLELRCRVLPENHPDIGEEHVCVEWCCMCGVDCCGNNTSTLTCSFFHEPTCLDVFCPWTT